MTNTVINTETISMEDEASKFGVSVVFGMSALIGIWGVACMIGGLASSGVGGMLRGYITAVTGL